MKFHCPPIYPFWLWNGDQNEKEISRQLRLMKQRGLPGVTIHARTGNRIPYLSERWMELFHHACTEAKRLGLAVWIYDELGFPSGTVNGTLPAMGEAFQQKSLHFSVCPTKDVQQSVGILRQFRKNSKETLLFRRHLLPGFSDFLNPQTAPLFLQLVHEKYYVALKEFFGNTIQAVFTDDNLFLLERGAVLPYTDDLEETFCSAYSYSLLDRLDCLVENRPESPRIRLDYYRHLALRLNEGFIRPMQDWCTAHGLKFYGHLSSDEGPLDYCARSFGEPGRYMMTLHTPGCDDFLTMYHDWSYLRNPRNHFKSIDCLNGTPGFSAIVVMKQASSVASQLGDGTCMSETFSSLGWGIPPASLIAHMNFLCLLGINLSVPHYYAYSTAAQAKRDHPASFFFQQPYFSQSREIFAETDRTLQLTARGKNAADTLVIYPAESVQVVLDGDCMDIPGNYQCEKKHNHPDCWAQSNLFQELSLALMRAHVGFEYGYESVLQQHGESRRNEIRVGKACYSTVILPGLVSISSCLCRLLSSAPGLRIIYLKQRPVMLDGIPVCKNSFPDGEFYLEVRDMDGHFPAPLLNGIQSPETGVSARLVGGRREYMLAHYGKEPVCQYLDLPGYVLYIPGTDQTRPLPAEYLLQPGRAIHLLPEKRQVRKQQQTEDSGLVRDAMLAGTWQITREHPNALLIGAARLPYCFLTRFDDADYPLQPEGTLSFLEFEVPGNCTKSLFFCYEPLETTLLKINGSNLLARHSVPCDMTSSLRAVKINRLLHHNRKNVLTFGTRTGRPEFFYLLGEFSVAFQNMKQPDGAGSEMPSFPVIAPCESPLRFGDLSRQGLPFYWGTVRYASTVLLPPAHKNGLAVEIPSAAAACITLKVNGIPAGTLTSAPWQWRVPKTLLHPGDNHLELLLVNTAQNFFGPHHPDAQKQHFSAWRPESEDFFSVASFGILDKPVLLI